MESVSAGHSTIFASLPLHCASNTGDQAAVIRSTTCAGGTNGATGCGGASKGGLAGGAEAVGLILLLASIPSPFHWIGENSKPQGLQQFLDRARVTPAGQRPPRGR